MAELEFRRLWSVWLIANLCVWMGDVAAAWLMTSLTTNKLMVAMVQTCTALPVLLLALPGGAIADIVDRRRALLAAQLWSGAMALVIAATALTDRLSAPLLLVLTVLASTSTALRWPVYTALVPDVVAGTSLPAAVVVGGMAVNTSRVLGPLAAGLVIAAAGGAWVFVVTSALSLFSAALLLRSRPAYAPSLEGSDRSPHGGLGRSIAAGLRFAREDALFRALLVWSFAFFVCATALMALLPLVAKGPGTGGAGTYTLLLACLGGGAVGVGFFMHKLRRRWSPHTVVAASTGLMAACTGVLAFLSADRPIVAASALMVCAGAAWVGAGNTLSVAAQLALPPALRARGLAIFLMAVMGGGAAGAMLFGAIAELAGLRAALACLSATAAVFAVTLGRHCRLH